MKHTFMTEIIMSKKILITGASGGFGKLISTTLLKHGHIVVASMRDIEGKNKIAAGTLKKAGAQIVEIDVTSDESVNNGVATSVEALGDIDVVINNAGIGAIGLQESFTPEDWAKLFDINVFGVQRVNRAVLPYMRKNNSGLILYISSVLGRVSLPFQAPYNASKWALEALAEGYRSEVSSLGIDSCIVEPGGHLTSAMDNFAKPSDKSRESDYGELASAPQGMNQGFKEALSTNPAQNPQNIANAVLHLIEKPMGQRQFRTVVDKMGMGDYITDLNGHQEQITKDIFNAFGMGDLLKLKA